MKRRYNSFRVLVRFILGLRHLFTLWDTVCTLVLSLASVLTLVVLIVGRPPSSTVEIKTHDETYVYSLDEDRKLNFEGPVGTTKIYIQDRQVGVSDSPGRLKICVKSSPISKSDQWLACLPNRIFIRIVGGQKPDTDAVSF